MSTGAHHDESFLRRYVFSTDHKIIARQYLFTGMAMALVGGLLAYVIRMQLAYPGQEVPGYGLVGPMAYNAVTTMHGTIMIFWVAMPILLAALGNLLIPLMVGTADMAFPRLNMLSYWIFLLSTIVLVSSFFVPGGAAAGGWTSYPPLAGSPAYSGGQWGVTLWILAVALEFAAFLMGGINFITTAINNRAPGMRLFDMPLMVWMQLAASIVFLFSVGPLIAGAIMLLLDRIASTGFYDPTVGGDPVLFQHLFWFFGHPEVYVILLPGLGAVAEILPVFSRKPIFGYRMIVYATILTGIMSFIVWAHHQFIAGIDPRLATPFSITTILISVPIAVITFSYMATLWRGSIELKTPMVFALGMIALFLLGGVTGIHNGTPAADIYIHDTYFVVAHFHYALIPPVFFASDLRLRERDLPPAIRPGHDGAPAAHLEPALLRGAQHPGGGSSPADRHGGCDRAPDLADPVPVQLLLEPGAGSPGRRQPLARQHAGVDGALASGPRQLRDDARGSPGSVRVQRAGGQRRLAVAGRPGLRVEARAFHQEVTRDRP
jgi:cytochrome c oxidase subunit 1